MSRSPGSSLSRRRFLQATAGGVAGLALGSRFAYANTNLPAPINRIKSGSKLRWVDSGDQKAVRDSCKNALHIHTHSFISDTTGHYYVEQ